MKEFEKWYLPDKDVYVNEYEIQKRAWRAALEMVLKIKVSSADCKTELDVLHDNIKQELR